MLNVKQKYMLSIIIAITSEQSKTGFSPKSEMAASIGFMLYFNKKRKVHIIHRLFTIHLHKLTAPCLVIVLIL